MNENRIRQSKDLTLGLIFSIVMFAVTSAGYLMTSETSTIRTTLVFQIIAYLSLFYIVTYCAFYVSSYLNSTEEAN